MYQQADAPPGGAMTPPAATKGLGDVPEMPNLPPPPTGAGAVDTGSSGTTKISAGGEAIEALRSLIGFVPSMANDINEIITKIKAATVPKPGENAGPALGKPGDIGSAQLDGSPTMESGSSGAM